MPFKTPEAAHEYEVKRAQTSKRKAAKSVYAKAHPEQDRARGARWRSTNLEHARALAVARQVPYRTKHFARIRGRVHSFTSADESRFVAATHCDWCAQPLNGIRPHVDHDHKCCSRKNGAHCKYCTRGFVHPHCNRLAIAYYEWLEKAFGILDSKLADYRQRFPVPRVFLKEAQDVV